MKVCPHCTSDLQGPPILDRPGENYSRTIMVEIRGIYDGGLFFQCPDCCGRWHRWPDGHPLRAKASRYVDRTGG